eukprot:Rhum_TRINITY_DN15190_c2_g1::Rhum_TRINITY_DN15190_c2_g1_i1::g.141932::m.141932
MHAALLLGEGVGHEAGKIRPAQAGQGIAAALQKAGNQPVHGAAHVHVLRLAHLVQGAGLDNLLRQHRHSGRQLLSLAVQPHNVRAGPQRGGLHTLLHRLRLLLLQVVLLAQRLRRHLQQLRQPCHQARLAQRDRRDRTPRAVKRNVPRRLGRRRNLLLVVLHEAHPRGHDEPETRHELLLHKLPLREQGRETLADRLAQRLVVRVVAPLHEGAEVLDEHRDLLLRLLVDGVAQLLAGGHLRLRVTLRQLLEDLLELARQLLPHARHRDGHRRRNLRCLRGGSSGSATGTAAPEGGEGGERVGGAGNGAKGAALRRTALSLRPAGCLRRHLSALLPSQGEASVACNEVQIL